MDEVGALRSPLTFERTHREGVLLDDPATPHHLAEGEQGRLATGGLVTHEATRAAACKPVMRAGRHYAQFTLRDGFGMFFGVIRPGWDVETGANAQCVMPWQHCFYDIYKGARYYGDTAAPGYTQQEHPWEGMQGARGCDDGGSMTGRAWEGDRIGLLLDLDQGSMTVYKNNKRLGVMVAEGLTGEFCWAISMLDEGSRVRISSGPMPRSVLTRSILTTKAAKNGGKRSWRRRQRGQKIFFKITQVRTVRTPIWTTSWAPMARGLMTDPMTTEEQCVRDSKMT